MRILSTAVGYRLHAFPMTTSRKSMSFFGECSWMKFCRTKTCKSFAGVSWKYFVDRRVAKMETMLVLRGSGSNGKSVVFETIMGILGRENVSNFGIGALITGNERKISLSLMASG